MQHVFHEYQHDSGYVVKFIWHGILWNSTTAGNANAKRTDFHHIMAFLTMRKYYSFLLVAHVIENRT